jgi:uncharacterized RDD family membrane protein YckC
VATELSGAPAPAAEQPPMGSPEALTAPPLWRRMACWVYEGILLFAVVFIAGWLFSTLGQMRDAMDARRPLLQAFLFVVFGVYFTWFWARGQTLAMKTWHIRIVDRTGRPLGQRRALLRYACSWIWFLPPIAVLAPLKPSGGQAILLMLAWVAVWALLSRFHPQRQFWHDELAGTRLVLDAPLNR